MIDDSAMTSDDEYKNLVRLIQDDGIESVLSAIDTMMTDEDSYEEAGRVSANLVTEAKKLRAAK